MSFKQDELQFWLPSDFLADDDDDDMDTKFRSSDSTSSRFLPPPVDGGSDSALSSPGKSVVGSTETESDEDVFLFSELTHQLSLLDPTRPNKKEDYVHSGSPQSTLLHVESFSGLSNGSSNGSPNGPSQVSSPPTTPLATDNNNSSWDLISRAAGLVEGLKTNSSGVLTSPINPPATVFQRQGSFSTLPPPKPAAAYPNSCTEKTISPFLQNVPNENLLGGVGYGIRADPVRNRPNNLYTGQKVDVLPAGNAGGWSPFLYSGYPNLQVGLGCGFQLGGGFGGGVGHGYGYGSANRVRVGDVVKNERVGTGVFLPRRFDEKNRGNTHISSNAVDARKKSGNNLAAHPVKKVPIMTKNLNNKSSSTQCQPKIFGCDTITNHDALLARKVSVPTLQRKTVAFPEVPIRHEICLPQEWTY